MSISTLTITELLQRFGKMFHRHRYDIPDAEEIKVGLIGGHHTSFLLLKCRCGDKLAFPEDNFKLALDYGTGETKKFLSEVGLC